MDLISTTEINSATDDIFSTYGLDGFEDLPIVPFIGLQNLGNSCFFNSVLQILFYCPGFQKSLTAVAELAKNIKDYGDEDIRNAAEDNDNLKLLLELHKLFILMKKNQHILSKPSDDIVDKENLKAVRPEGLMEILRKVYPAFEPYTQQDAQECLRCILSILEDAIEPLNGRNEESKKPMMKENTFKMFGGRKFGSTVVGSSNNEKSQRENQDPNVSSIKQESRTTASRKKHMKTFLRKPLRMKFHSDVPASQFQENNKDNSKSALDGPLYPLTENENSRNVQSSGCFGKLGKKHSTLQNNIDMKSSSSLISTPTKRPSSYDITSLSPPIKRKKLNLANGIKSFYKPFSSNLNKSKSLWQSDKKKSYSFADTEKSGKRNPFKVILKASQPSQYRKLDPEDTKSNILESDTTTHTLTDLILDEKTERKQNDKINSEETVKAMKPFVVNLFQGELVNEIRCMECENSVQRKEPFMDISLPVRENKKESLFTAECSIEDISEVVSLMTCMNMGNQGCTPSLLKQIFKPSSDDEEEASVDCSVIWGLSAFTCREILEGENKYFCGKCCRYSEGERRLQFFSLPPILTFHLKRFSTSKPHVGGDAFCSTVSKINSCLSVPLELCLQQWCTASYDKRQAKYALFGIIIHSGITISSGHYLSYVKLHNSSLLEVDENLETYRGNWLEADDERTRIITEKELLDVVSPKDVEGVSRTPYLLFYHRVDQTDLDIPTHSSE